MRRILLIVFIITGSYFCQAQKFHGGLFAGIAASQISGDQLTGFNKAGVYAGAFSNYFFTPKSALQLELYFIQKGSHKSQHPKNDDYIAYNLNLQYIEMALVYQWHFIKRFYLEGGPGLGVILNTLAVEKDANGKIPNYSRPRFNQFDFSAIAGLGVNISKHFKANIRGENSLIPVRRPVVGTSFRLDRLQFNSLITLSLIYEI